MPSCLLSCFIIIKAFMIIATSVAIIAWLDTLNNLRKTIILHNFKMKESLARKLFFLILMFLKKIIQQVRTFNDKNCESKGEEIN